MTKVSVIIPVYNVEKFLSECLDSVVNQTLTDIEIICVNDGSTDNSASILSEYAKKDSRIKIITQENQGISEARNVAMKIATGEYIAFLDSDDFVGLDFYEKMYNRAIETNSDIVVSEYVYRFKKNKKKLFLKVDKKVVTTNAKEKFECLYLPCYCYVWNKIYKRECVKVKFLKGIKWEDVYFTCETLLHSNRLSVASDTAYYYRDNEKSIVNEKTNINNYYYHKAFAYFYDFVCKNEINIEENKFYEQKKYKILGMTILNVKRHNYKTNYRCLDFIRWSTPFLSNRKSRLHKKVK